MTLKKLIIVANTIEKKLNKFADVANTDTLANIVNAVSSKFSDTLKIYMSAHMKKNNISELQCRFFLNMKFSNKKCIDCKVTIVPSGPLSNNKEFIKNFIESYSTLVSPLEPNIKATVDNVNLKERLPVENDYPVVKLFEHTFYATRSTTASNTVSKLQSVADDIERSLKLNKIAQEFSLQKSDIEAAIVPLYESNKDKINALFDKAQIPVGKRVEVKVLVSENFSVKVYGESADQSIAKNILTLNKLLQSWIPALTTAIKSSDLVKKGAKPSAGMDPCNWFYLE